MDNSCGGSQDTAHAEQLLPWLIMTLTQNRGYDNESAQNEGCLYWDGENEDKRNDISQKG